MTSTAFTIITGASRGIGRALTEMQTQTRDIKPADFPSVERFISLKNDGHLLEPSVPASAIRKLLEEPDFPEDVILDIREMKGVIE